jgi:hypothetical protein
LTSAPTSSRSSSPPTVHAPTAPTPPTLPASASRKLKKVLRASQLLKFFGRDSFLFYASLVLGAHYAHEWSTANTGALASYPPLTVPSALGIKLAHDVKLTFDTVQNTVTKVPRSLAASPTLVAPCCSYCRCFWFFLSDVASSSHKEGGCHGRWSGRWTY